MTRAAERLHMSQSAVSRKVQRLEDRVGRPLFIRDGHDLRLTRDGRILVADARKIVDLHDAAVARLESSDLTGTVRLASNGEVNPCQIASLIGTFKHRHRHARVEFALDHTGALSQDVDEGKIDIAVLQVDKAHLRETDIVLWEEDLVWTTSVADNFNESPVPMIDFGVHCYYNDFTHLLLNEAGIEFMPVFSASSSIDVTAAVEAGIGVAVLSRRYLGPDVVEWDPPAEIGPLPQVLQVVRIVPGERPEAVDALVALIQSEFTRGRAA